MAAAIATGQHTNWRGCVEATITMWSNEYTVPEKLVETTQEDSLHVPGYATMSKIILNTCQINVFSVVNLYIVKIFINFMRHNVLC